MFKKLVVLVFCTFFFFGCAGKDLVKEAKTLKDLQMLIAEAKTTIAEAKEAGANKYAKELLDSAESRVVVAEDALEKGELEVATSFAIKALDEARAAKGKALAGSAIEKAAVELKAAKAAGAEKIAPGLIKLANEYLIAALKKNTEKDYAGVLDPAKKAYEHAVEAKRLCELVKQAEALIEEAKIDIAEAVKAGAKRHAPELLKSAEENLAKAITAFGEKDYIKAIDHAGRASDDAKAARSSCVAANAGKYTVKSGDNLWNIAKDGKVLDDPFLWPLIYKSNRDKIKDPDWIFPLQEFELPPAFDDKAKKDALKDAIKYKIK